MDSQRHLYVFLKHAAPGAVKTRLAAEIGERRACEVYRQLVALTVDRMDFTDDDRITLIAYFDPPEREAEIRALVPGDWQLVVQPAGDLTARLAAAFRERGCDTIVIGSDCPDITAVHVRMAFENIADDRCVIGPTRDGGFYLFGGRDLPDDLFDGVPWSQDGTSAMLRQRVVASSRQIWTLPELYDVDTIADLRRWESSDVSC